MKKAIVYGTYVYFICAFLLLPMGSFSPISASAKERLVPMGEMISNGDVKFEARENHWREVESSYFPIFQGIRIKTEKGAAIISLDNNSQIELGSDSVLFFEQSNRLSLSQGRVDFRMPSYSEMNIRVKDVSISLARSLQASKGPSAIPESNKQAIGSILIHPNGAVTVKSLQGSLSVINYDKNVLASLSSKESLTIPSALSSKRQRLAQVGDTNDDRKNSPGPFEMGAGAAAGAAAGGGLGAGAGLWGSTSLVMLGLGGALGGAAGIAYHNYHEGGETPACCVPCPKSVTLCR